MIERIKNECVKYEQAAKEYSSFVFQNITAGSIVRVNRSGGIHEMEIISHTGYWWDNPGRLRGRNIKTGKTWTFDATDIVEIVREVVSC